MTLMEIKYYQKQILILFFTIIYQIINKNSSITDLYIRDKQKAKPSYH